MAGLFDDLKGGGAAQPASAGLFDDLKPKTKGIGGTLIEGAKSTGRALASTVDAYTGDTQGVADRAAAQQQAQRDPRLEKFQSDYAERTAALGDDPGLLPTIAQGVGAVVDNPAGAGLAVLEQLPNAAVTLGAGWAGMKAGAAVGGGIGSLGAGVGALPGAAVGGVVGGLAGMFAANAALETGNKAMAAADDGEVTAEELSQARREGAIKGGVITGVDALTLGVGGKVASTLQRTSSTALEAATRKVLVDRGVDVSSEAAVLAARANPEIAAAVRTAQDNARKATDSLGRRVATGGALLGMETIGEGAGEYLGELAATGEGNIPDAVLESLLSLGQSTAEAGWNMARTRMVQPAPSAENPQPAPVPAPDPSAGAVSRAAAMLPAPDRLALPAPEPVLYADSEGNLTEAGPERDVDRELRPVPGRAEPSPMTGGPGMDQQTPRGVLGLIGDLMPAARASESMPMAPPMEPMTIEDEVVRQGIPDLRPEAVIVDGQGGARTGRVANLQPAEPAAQADGMTAQAVPGQRPAFHQVLERARAGGVDAAGLAAQTGATRAQAARAIRGADAERAVIESTFKSVPGANKALRGLPEPQAFEVIKAGPREWRIQRRQEVQGGDSGGRAGDVGVGGNAPHVSDAAPDLAGVPVVAERPADTGGGEKAAAVDAAAPAPADRSGSLTEPAAVPEAAERADGTTEVLDKGMTIVHGSGNPSMQAGDIQIVRASGQKQGKAGRVYGGFYGTSEADAVQAEGYAGMMGGTPTLYDVKVKPGTKVLNKTGDITRLSEAYINELVSQGYGVVTGKDPRGRTEHVVIDKNAVESMAARRKPAKQQAPAKQAPAGEALPDILTSTRKRYIERQAKASGLKKGAPGYDQAVQRLQGQYEADVDRASASLTFEQYNTLNSDSPEGVNRQAWEALRQEFGETSYSRGSYRRSGPTSGSAAADVRRQLARLIGGWQNAPKVTVVQSAKDLPDALRRQVERDGAFDVEGMFAEGQVYLVADNLRDVKHAAFVLQHEVLGHAGLQGAYGRRLTPLLMSIYNGNPELKQQADTLVQQYGYTPAVAMEEVLADMAAAGTLSQQPFWARLVTAMRNALRSIGLDVRWSEGDIQGLLAIARRYIVNGRTRSGARAAFSRDGRSGRGPEITDDQGRLLAPNGKPSQLNQRQWHQVRSGNFKRWFGNWQGMAAEARLDAMAPIKVRAPDDWRGLSVADMQSRLRDRLDQMVKSRTVFEHPELGMIRIGRKGKEKTVSAGRDPAKLVAANALDVLLARSIYGVTDPSNEQGVQGYHRLYAPVEIDGNQLVAIFTVRQQTDGEWYYNTVAVEDGNKKRPGSNESPGAQKRPLGETPITGLANFVRRPFSRVNPDTVSKVTDGNGEPLVMYHGTGEEFNIFEQGRAGRSTGHATAPLGIFMTSDRTVAQGYAEKASDGMPGLANVMPLFASIKKPYRMSLAESQALDTADAAIAFRQRLEGEGYDGIQLGNTGTWIAFYNNQVKSATNNTGAFDEVDPDIRYSRAGQRDIEALRKLGLAGSEARNLLDRVRNLTLGGLQQTIKDWSVRSEEGIFDGLAGIRRAEASVGVTDPERQGYVSARMASGIADVMHGVLHYAAPEWRDGVVSGKAGTRGVLEILGDLGPDNLTPWLAWLGGKRAELLKAQGRENNLTDADIAELLAMGRGKEDLFEKVYREYAQVNEAVLDLAQEAGLIDQDARAKWLTEYYVPFYRQDEAEGVFTAPRSKRGLSHQTAAIKALKGGTLPTNDLLANMLAGWTKRIDASMKNKALLEVVENLKGSDYLADESPRWQQVLISRDQIAQQIRKDRKAQALAAEMLDLPAGAKLLQVLNKLHSPEAEGFEQLWTRVAPTDPDIIRVQRDGKSEYYRVNDESLLRGLKFMEGSVFNDPITKVGRAFKRMLTTGVTASPDFILRNFIRDAAHAWMINKDGFKLGTDSIRGMRDALREDQDYRDLMFAGGSFQGGYVHGADPEASAQIIRRALEKKGFTRAQQEAYLGSLVNTPAKAAAMLGKGWQRYRELGDKVENANRLSTYKAALAAGKGRRQASFEAKDLMDYSLRGNFAAAQWFTDVVPFLNARLQGLYKLGRAVKGDKTLLAKEVAMKGAYIALFSLLLAGINDDDERYQALQDWDKDMHWHIFLGDEHFRIPKPFELGLLFGTVPERLLHTMTGSQDSGDLAKAVSQGVFQTLAFNPVPQFYQPIRELQANRNFFRDSPIEDMSDEGKLPEARYDERTSAISRGLGQVTGPLLGLSPKQLDHLVMGYTGTLGGYVLAASSLVTGFFSEGDRPSTRAADLPVAKVIYQGNAVTTSKYQAEFYDMMREADQLQRTINSYRDEGRLEAAAGLLESSREKLRHRPALGAARRQLGQIRNQMDAVYRDPVMSGEQKRQRLDELQRRANATAERVVKLAGADF